MSINCEFMLDGSVAIIPGQYPAAAGKANSFTLVAGPNPGRGWLLFTKSDLGNVTRAESGGSGTGPFHELEIRQNQSPFKFRGIVALKGERITAGKLADDNGLYLVEIADKRWSLNQFGYMSDSYNVRLPVAPYDGFTAARFWPESLSGGTTMYTWQTMLDGIWSYLPSGISAGTSPVLPFTPDGKPEGWRFHGVNPWKAWNTVLAKLSCVAVYDPTYGSDGKFTIQRLGATQSGLTTAENNNKPMIELDAEPISFNATLPKVIGTLFQRFQLAPNADYFDTPIYKKDTNTDITSTITGAILPVWDDLLTTYLPDDTPQNEAACDTRAAEIAAAVKTDLQTARQRRIYAGFCGEFKCGSQVKVIQWRNFGPMMGGMQTEVLQHPGLPSRLGPMNGGLEDMEWDLGEHLAPPDLSRRKPPHGWKIEGKAASAISAGTSTVPGSGTMRIWSDPDNDGTWSDSGVDVTILNFSATEVTAGAWLQAAWDGQRYVNDYEDCG